MSDIWIPYGGGTDLDPVTAGAADVRKGKVIVDKNGNPLTGTMAEIAAKTYTPGTANQVIAANQFLAGAQTIKGDGNLTANYIVNGKSIFGVAGNVKRFNSKSGTVTSANSTKYHNGPSAWMYYAEIPIGMTVSLLAWTDGDLIGAYWGNPVHIRGGGYGFDYNTDSTWYINSTKAVVPVTVGGRTVWYCVAGY